MATPTSPKTPNHGEDGPNGWAEYRRLVISELERIGAEAAKAVQHSTSVQLALTQALADSRTNLLDKIRETASKVEDENDRKLELNKKDFEEKFRLMRDESDRHGREISALKAKAALIGGIAGFLVALAGLIVSIVIKH